MSALTSFQAGSSGVSMARHLMGKDDEPFHKDAVKSQWYQTWHKYTYHQGALVLQTLTNTGLSKGMRGDLMRTAALQGVSYTVAKWNGLKANRSKQAKVSKTSYVNARGFYAIKQLSVKVGTSDLFKIDGHQMLCLAELLGLLSAYKDAVGLSYTIPELIKQSSREKYTFTPWIGLPMNDSPARALAVGGVSWHHIYCDISTRSAQELVVNYDGVTAKSGLFAMPMEIGTGAAFNNSSVDFVNATNLYWVSDQELTNIEDGYREVLFKEVKNAGQKLIKSSELEHYEDIDITMKGPVTYLFATFQSLDDLEAGNHTKLCNDEGDDYIDELMLIGGHQAVEDGMPAVFYRTLKVLEVFKTKINRHIYVIGFETDDSAAQFNGQRNFTNYEGLKLRTKFKAHSCALQARVDYSVINCQYTDNGAIGKSYE